MFDPIEDADQPSRKPPFGPESAGVTVDTDEEFDGVDLARHQRFAQVLLEAAGEGESELAILLTSDETIRQYNHDYRGNDQPTDVLSFPQREGESMGQFYPLGDIVISVDTARRQSEEYGHGLPEEIDELIFHGVLHLLGYDHDGENQDAWHQTEENLVHALQCIQVPYIPKGMTPLENHSINEKGS